MAKLKSFTSLNESQNSRHSGSKKIHETSLKILVTYLTNKSDNFCKQDYSGVLDTRLVWYSNGQG